MYLRVRVVFAAVVILACVRWCVRCLECGSRVVCVWRGAEFCSQIEAVWRHVSPPTMTGFLSMSFHNKLAYSCKKKKLTISSLALQCNPYVCMNASSVCCFCDSCVRTVVCAVSCVWVSSCVCGVERSFARRLKLFGGMFLPRP